jgi:hypothetical protein
MMNEVAVSDSINQWHINHSLMTYITHDQVMATMMHTTTRQDWYEMSTQSHINSHTKRTMPSPMNKSKDGGSNEQLFYVLWTVLGYIISWCQLFVQMTVCVLNYCGRSVNAPRHWYITMSERYKDEQLGFMSIDCVTVEHLVMPWVKNAHIIIMSKGARPYSWHFVQLTVNRHSTTHTN